jgi:hypothetical protein
VDSHYIQKLCLNVCPVLKVVATVRIGFRKQKISFNFGFSKSLQAGSSFVTRFYIFGWIGRLDYPSSSIVFSSE